MKQYILVVTILLLTGRKTGCETILTCGGIGEETEDVIHFKSEDYPSKMHSGNSDCKVVIKLNALVHSLRIDFKNVTMDGQLLAGHYSQRSGCDADMFIFRGFVGWTPPARCGQLTNYSFMISLSKDTWLDDLEIVALMSSSAYQWHIVVTRVLNFQSEQHVSSLLRFMSETEYNFNRIKLSKREVPLVRNGNNTSISKVPWQASIRDLSVFNDSIRSSNKGTHVCGGVIIDDQYILTAAHCFYGWSKFRPMRNLTNTKIVLGDSNVCQDSEDFMEPKSQDYLIDTVIFHVGYDPYFPLHDIAVVRLQTKIDFKKNQIESIKIGGYGYGKVLISGFGSWNETHNSYSRKEWNEETPRHYPCQLQIAEVQLSNRSLCLCNELEREVNNKYTRCDVIMSPKYNRLLYPMCSVTNISDQNAAKITHADSGGPVVKSNGTHHVLVGLVLSNRKTGNISYDNYLPVRTYRGFIGLTVTSFSLNASEPMKRKTNENLNCFRHLKSIYESNLAKFRVYRESRCKEIVVQSGIFGCGYSNEDLKDFYHNTTLQRPGDKILIVERPSRESTNLTITEKCGNFTTVETTIPFDLYFDFYFY